MLRQLNLRLVPILVILLLCGSNTFASTLDSSRFTAYTTLKQQVDAAGEVAVIVGIQTRSLYVSDALLSAQAAVDQRTEIAAAQTTVVSELAGTAVSHVKQFKYIPYMALTVDAAGLEKLANSPNITHLQADTLVTDTLSTSVNTSSTTRLNENLAAIGVSGSGGAWEMGVDGTGMTIGLIAGGFDATHPVLAGKILGEACYSTNSSYSASFCPNAATFVEGAGSASLGWPWCSPGGYCSESTGEAGMIAGYDATTGFSGVARGANMFIVQTLAKRISSYDCSSVGQTSPCAIGVISDTVLGHEYLYERREQIGLDVIYSGIHLIGYTSALDCHTKEPAWTAAINAFFDAGIPVVSYSGSNSSIDKVLLPSCIPVVTAVGPSGYDFTIPTTANSGQLLDLLAPGVEVSAPWAGGYSIYNGSGIASVQVVGAYTLLRQASPDKTSQELLDALRTTGIPVTDPRNGITRSFIQVNAAITQLLNNTTPSFLISSSTLNLPRNGQGFVTFRLSTPPAAPIVVQLTSLTPNACSITPSLTLDATNWSTSRHNVVITDIPNGSYNNNCAFDFTVTTSDTTYSQLGNPNQYIINIDNDQTEYVQDGNFEANAGEWKVRRARLTTDKVKASGAIKNLANSGLFAVKIAGGGRVKQPLNIYGYSGDVLTFGAWMRVSQPTNVTAMLKLTYSSSLREKIKLKLTKGDYGYYAKSVTLNGYLTDAVVLVKVRPGALPAFLDDVSVVIDRDPAVRDWLPLPAAP